MSRMDNFLLVCCVLCVLSFPAQAFDHTLEFNIGNNLLTQIPDNYFPELSFKQLPQTAPDMILEHIRLQGERAFFYHRNLRLTLEEQN